MYYNETMHDKNTLTSPEFKKLLDSSQYTLIDLRTSWELTSYWVISPKQIHIDITLANTQEKLEALDLKGKYLIYCWHGVRSKQVLNYMLEQWFEEVYDLDGGIDAWNKLL